MYPLHAGLNFVELSERGELMLCPMTSFLHSLSFAVAVMLWPAIALLRLKKEHFFLQASERFFVSCITVHISLHLVLWGAV